MMVCFLLYSWLGLYLDQEYILLLPKQNLFFVDKIRTGSRLPASDAFFVILLKLLFPYHSKVCNTLSLIERCFGV